MGDIGKGGMERVGAIWLIGCVGAKVALAGGVDKWGFTVRIYLNKYGDSGVLLVDGVFLN